MVITITRMIVMMIMIITSLIIVIFTNIITISTPIHKIRFMETNKHTHFSIYPFICVDMQISKERQNVIDTQYLEGNKRTHLSYALR